ncbi:hypothetical protein FOY91_18290 [Sphingomonas solaris]|uniref:Uncharacterized protein n=2 Tax=Alterirhizorhabdus solaris TaxID=2529389 RepID=A0A558QUQ0_9SPHN|nr:hypothetical protein FOY91_18290 [Sphingomonas solaris]
MGALPRPSGPRAVWRDFKAFLNTEQRYRWIGLALAIFMPALMLAGFYVDSKKDPPKPQTIFVQSWPADRPDSVIIEQNRIDQAKKEARLAERQRQFKKLAKDLGIE